MAEQKTDGTEGFTVVTSDAPQGIPDLIQQARGDAPTNAGDTADAGVPDDHTADSSTDKDDASADENAAKAKPATDASDSGRSRRKESRLQKRIDKLEALLKEKRELESRDKQDSVPDAGDKTTPAQKTAKEPDPEDFGDDWQGYLDALADWNRGRSAVEKSAGDDQKPGKADAKPEKQDDPDLADALEELTEAFEQAADKYEDFTAVVHAKDLAITPDMVKGLAECDDPAKVAYYLGNHKKEAAEIARLSPIGQARALGRIDALLDAGKIRTGKKISSAPEPITPEAGSSDSKTRTLQDMSFREFEQARNEQERRRGGSFW